VTPKGASCKWDPVRLAGWACVLLFVSAFTERVPGQYYPSPTPPLTPPPPGRSYGSGYGPSSSGYGNYGSGSYGGYGSSYYQPGSSYSPYSPGSGTGTYATRYRDSRTGRYGATPTPVTGTGSSAYGQYGRTPRGATPTPRGYKPTPTPRGATPTPGAPGEGPASTRGQVRPPTVLRGGPATPAARAAAARGPLVTASFSFKPAPDVAVLYVTPLQAKLAVGEEFETRVSLSNPGKKEFQTVEVLLRFDPDVIEPIRLDEDAISPLLEGPSESVVYTQAGILAYQARLTQPSSAQAMDFFTIRWKTLAISTHAEINFTSWQSRRTALLDQAKDTILGGTGNEGSLGMTLQIYSPEALADGPPIGDELFAGPHPATRGGVRLRLITNRQKIPANEDFYVGVWFENPRLVDISKITMKLRYDPRVLEVVDDDANNWITSGVNIFDGEYHDSFPFDIHIENSASNDIGLISYAMACTQRRALPEQGYIARIRFRPKVLADSTRIGFVLRPDDDPMRTQVSYLGGDVLGAPDRDDDGVANLTVRIGEPQLPRLLATEK